MKRSREYTLKKSLRIDSDLALIINDIALLDHESDSGTIRTLINEGIIYRILKGELPYEYRSLPEPIDQ